jgi:hypothetical protein
MCNTESLIQVLKEWAELCENYQERNSQRDERKLERESKEPDEGVEQGRDTNQRD